MIKRISGVALALLIIGVVVMAVRESRVRRIAPAVIPVEESSAEYPAPGLTIESVVIPDSL